MPDISLRKQKIGLLFQPTTIVNTQTSFVGVGTVENNWENVQDESVTYFPIRGEQQVLSPDPKVDIPDIKEIGSDTMFIEEQRLFVDKKSGLPAIKITAYASPTILSAFLISALQDAEQNSTNGVITINPKDGDDDFANGNGILFSLAGWSYTDDNGWGDGYILKNAVVDSLVVSFGNTLGDYPNRLVKLEATIVGSDLEEGITSVNFGTPENYIFRSGNADPDKFSMTLKINGKTYSDICFKDFTLTINNNYTTDCLTKDFSVGNLKRSNPEISISFGLPYNDFTAQFTSTFGQGTTFAVIVTNSVADETTVKYVNFNIERAILTEPLRTSDGEYLAQKWNAKVLRPSVGWNGMVILNDGNDWSNTGVTIISS